MALIAGIETTDDYLVEIIERQEVLAVVCVERKAGGEGRSRDEPVDGSGTSS